ncbi:MAG: copper amine oxidase N-terminal domain-containing protein [Clostridia bacterium]
MEQKKAEREQAKLETKEYVDEIKAIFKDADVETRKEILACIAAAKAELKDYSIGTFVKGIAVDFDKYDGVEPVIQNNRTLVPLRAISEAYGAEVEWDGETQTIIITKDETVIVMQIGSEKAYVNDEEVTLDVAPKMVKYRTLVPLRFISEAFGFKVEWDQESLTVVID